LVVLFLTVFIDLMGFGIVIPLLPIYAKQMNATPFAAGALIAVYSLMQLVFAPVWGRISDDIGRRPVLLMCLAGSAMSYLLLAGAWRLEVLFFARLLAGVAGASIPVAQAYIADVTGPAERARGMGLIGAAFGLGMVIGPALGVHGPGGGGRPGLARRPARPAPARARADRPGQRRARPGFPRDPLRRVSDRAAHGARAGGGRAGPRQPLALEPDLEDGRGVRVRRGARGIAVPVGGRPRPRTGGWGTHLQPLRRLRSVPRRGGGRGRG